MKKCILIIPLIFLAISTANAQSRVHKPKKGFKIAIKNNILSYINLTYNFSLECRIKGRHSLQGVVQYYEDRRPKSSWFTGSGAQMNMNGYGIGLEYRFYTDPTKDAFKGFYVSPYFRHIYRDIEFHADPHIGDGKILFERELTCYGLVVGIQRISRYFIGTDIFFGFGVRNKNDYNFDYGDQPGNELDDFIDDKAEIRFGLNLVLSNA